MEMSCEIGNHHHNLVSYSFIRKEEHLKKDTNSYDQTQGFETKYESN